MLAIGGIGGVLYVLLRIKENIWAISLAMGPWAALCFMFLKIKSTVFGAPSEKMINYLKSKAFKVSRITGQLYFNQIPAP
jgi:hypothetical protein